MQQDFRKAAAELLKKHGLKTNQQSESGDESADESGEAGSSDEDDDDEDGEDDESADDGSADVPVQNGNGLANGHHPAADDHSSEDDDSSDGDESASADGSSEDDQTGAAADDTLAGTPMLMLDHFANQLAHKSASMAVNRACCLHQQH